MKALKLVVRVLGLLLMALGGATVVLWLFLHKDITSMTGKELACGVELWSAHAAPMLCSPAQAKEARHILDRQVQRTKEILEASTLVQTDADGHELWDTPRGRYWVLPRESSCLASELAEQDAGIYEWGQEGVHEGDVVLDGGAHYGAYVRQALNRGAKLVVAIEIAPDSVACLRKTFADEIGAGRVVVYPKGIWDKDDTLTLQLDNLSDGNNVTSTRDRQGPKVPLTTIDRIVAELGLPKVDFVKMDIEGAEPKAIAGATQTLRKYRPRLAISSYHREDDVVALLNGVREIFPTYWVSLGPCKVHDERLVPSILFFH